MKIFVGWCVITIFSLYISIIILVIKHHTYLRLLTSNVKTKFNSKRRINIIYSRQTFPQFREEFLLYESFYTNDYHMYIIPHFKMQIFGLMKQNSPCIIRTLKSKAKTIIVLNDLEYADNMLDSLQKIFRIVLLLCTGGYITWILCSMFVI